MTTVELKLENKRLKEVNKKFSDHITVLWNENQKQKENIDQFSEMQNFETDIKKEL